MGLFGMPRLHDPFLDMCTILVAGHPDLAMDRLRVGSLL